MSVRLLVTITVQPGLRDQQIAAFDRLAPLVRAEEGCLRYELLAVAGDPERFVIDEEWESRTALAAHSAAEHMLAASAANAAFRAGPAEVVELVPADAVS
jgi:quinol monooxygenase YgiN